MKRVVCKHCNEWVQVKPFLVYWEFQGYFIGICPECKCVAYEKPVEVKDDISNL